MSVEKWVSGRRQRLPESLDFIQPTLVDNIPHVCIHFFGRPPSKKFLHRMNIELRWTVKNPITITREGRYTYRLAIRTKIEYEAITHKEIEWYVVAYLGQNWRFVNKDFYMVSIDRYTCRGWERDFWVEKHSKELLAHWGDLSMVIASSVEREWQLGYVC